MFPLGYRLSPVQQRNVTATHKTHAYVYVARLVQELNQVMSDINLRLDISFDDFIDRLNIQGFLLKSGPNAYKLVAA